MIEFFELVLSGRWTLVGTLIGLACAFAIHAFVHPAAWSNLMGAAAVAIGFAFGLFMDSGERR